MWTSGWTLHSRKRHGRSQREVNNTAQCANGTICAVWCRFTLAAVGWRLLYKGQNGKMIRESERIWKEAVVAYGGTVHGRDWGQPLKTLVWRMDRPGFESSISEHRATPYRWSVGWYRRYRAPYCFHLHGGACAWRKGRQADIPSARKQIPHILWNPKVHYRVHYSQPFVPIMWQMNSVLSL